MSVGSPSAAGLSGPPPAVVAWSDAAVWDDYVRRHPDACGYHLWAWRRLFEDVFGHRTVYLLAERAGRPVGVLPLVEFQSTLFGRFLVSLPFLNYGGLVADDPPAADSLVAAAGRLARERRCSHVELRHAERRCHTLVPRQHKVAMTLPLPASTDALWNDLDRKVRNQVRKAEKSGLTVVTGGRELVGEFYQVFARNMRDLGTPVYPVALFEFVLDTFPDAASVVVVRQGASAVAAGITCRWRDRVEVPWASSLREFNSLAPNNLLYWTILQNAIGAGASLLDFGRSTPNAGTFHFKKQWGAQPAPLYWEYDLVRGEVPDQGPTNPKFQLAVRTWQRLPLTVANWLGPHIVRSIP